MLMKLKGTSVTVDGVKVLSWITHPSDISLDLFLALPAILGPSVWRYALFRWFNYCFVIFDFVLEIYIRLFADVLYYIPDI